jgi:hypothetical protein
MRTLLLLAALTWTLPGLACSFDLPKISLGPYGGADLLNCATINERVLCVGGDPSLGVAPVLGGEIKLLFPKNYFLGVNLSNSVQQTVGHDPDTLGEKATDGKLKVVPLYFTLGKDFHLMPKLYWSAGLSAGYTWARVDIDTDEILLNGQRYRTHTVARGGNPTLGWLLGMNLQIHRHVDFSVKLGYHFGNIKSLKVIDSTVPSMIGGTLTYYDGSSNSQQLLPLDITNAFFYYCIRYNF